MTADRGPDVPHHAGADADDQLGGLPHGLDPQVALRPGRFDPFALWIVYLLRRTFFPLAFLSTIVLSLTGRDGETLAGVDTVGEFLEAVRSPLVLLVVATMIRVMATILGFMFAYPLSHRAPLAISPHQGRWSAWGRLMDRLHVTRAYRSLRWTKAVRDVAAERIGPTADWFRAIERLLAWSFPMLVVASIVAHAVAD